MTLGLRERPGTLPAEATTFVGRQREVADISGLLRTARLVTVCGSAGVGKTRTALRAAARIGGEYSDGLCLVELSGLREAELLPNTVAATLGLAEQEARSQLDVVVEYLRDRKLLLVLDTCEHLVDACAMFADVLLRATEGITVLATSRQPLDVPGEHTYSLPPMPVPSPDDSADSDVVALFAQCAAAVTPGFAVTEANRADVVRLCAQLDGLPLAIELAAVRLRAIPLTQLLGALEQRFRLLAGGRRASLPHHQTLRAAVEWSYDLCTPAERQLWARLSVFAGPFGLATVEDVCAGYPLAEDDLLTTLIALVDKSIVLREDGGDARYRMLDTIREFGAEMLAGSGEEGAVRDRHLDRFLARAIWLGDHPVDDDQVPRFAELRLEHRDLRAALDYGIRTPGRTRDAARIAATLYVYWQLGGALSEGRYWLGKVRDLLDEDAAERAAALVTDGYLAAGQGDSAAAIASLEAGIELAEKTQDSAALGLGCLFLNIAQAFGGNYPAAFAAEARARQQLDASGNRAALVILDGQMSYLHIVSGDPAEGIVRAKQGLQRLEAARNERWQRSYLHLLLGFGAYLVGDLASGATEFLDGLAMKHEIGDLMGIGYALEGSAYVAAALGRHTRAAWLLGAADPLWEMLGSRLGRNPGLLGVRDQVEQAVRTALGPDDYDALFRRGARGPFDQVVRLAIEDADELPEPSPPDFPAPSVLTSREQQIAALVAEGMSNRQIAEHLVLSKRTVDAHIDHIFAKLDMSSRVQVATWLKSQAG
jgi:predicted ATPase/DNA-binding CsgD family transcriptional regulator